MNDAAPLEFTEEILTHLAQAARDADDALEARLQAKTAHELDALRDTLEKSHLSQVSVLCADVRAIVGRLHALEELGAAFGKTVNDAVHEAVLEVTRGECDHLRRASALHREELTDATLRTMQRHADAIEQARAATAAVKNGAPGEPGPQGVAGARGPAGALTEVTAYKAGTLYDAGAIVRHDGRIWQSFAQTDSAPCVNGKWLLWPFGFKFCGPFEPGREYFENDIVQGSTGAQWVARDHISAGGECPGPHWLLWLKQGKKGAEGKQGERGVQGTPGTPAPTVIEVSVTDKAFAFLFDDGTVQVASFDLRAFVLRCLEER